MVPAHIVLTMAGCLELDYDMDGSLDYDYKDQEELPIADKIGEDSNGESGGEISARCKMTGENKSKERMSAEQNKPMKATKRSLTVKAMMLSVGPEKAK